MSSKIVTVGIFSRVVMSGVFNDTLLTPPGTWNQHQSKVASSIMRILTTYMSRSSISSGKTCFTISCRGTLTFVT